MHTHTQQTHTHIKEKIKPEGVGEGERAERVGEGVLEGVGEAKEDCSGG